MGTKVISTFNTRAYVNVAAYSERKNSPSKLPNIRGITMHVLTTATGHKGLKIDLNGLGLAPPTPCSINSRCTCTVQAVSEEYR